MRLDDDLIPANQIPKVRDLCQALGFGAPSHSFLRSLIIWRRNHKTAFGKSGMDITDWTSATERHTLGLMVQHYLETDGHGDRKWPSDGMPRTRLKYPNDEIE